MKNILKKFVKILYVAILPILSVSCVIMYFTQYGIGYTPVAIIIVLLAVLSIINALCFTVFMDKIVILPKIHCEFVPIIGAAIAWYEKKLIIILPLITMEVEW